MAVKISRGFVKRFMKALFTLVLWFLSIPKRAVEKSFPCGITLLGPDNIHVIEEGDWIIVFNKPSAIKCKDLLEHKIGLIQVSDLEKAKLAALFQPREYSEIIHYKNGRISSKHGNRAKLSEVSYATAFDHYVFFRLKDVQKAFLSINGLKNIMISVKGIVEDLINNEILIV